MTDVLSPEIQGLSQRIKKLPSELINQIAAGEVVERPANLIKELVENSLDAGANRIEVHLSEGGLKEITVIDDGRGICEEDLPLAVERHTTSKLSKLEDLESIGTFGFRGEALSSIASVSDFTIRSRTPQASRGVALHVPFGENKELKPVGCAPGTQVCAKELFAKIPARFKFLRSQATELSHCVKVFKELALGNPEVSFFLHHNGKLLSKFTSTSRLSRLKECLKPDWEPLHLEDSIEEMRYEAFLSPPDRALERGELNLFINRRPVRNRLLLSSLKNSFLEILGPNYELSGTFYLDIQGDWVDINVHPQKLEVRFYRQEKIYSWILTSIKKQLPTLNKNSVPPQTEVFRQSFSQSPLLNSKQLFKFIGVLGPYYLLVENEEGLFIVNRIALAKRNLFLKYKTVLTNGVFQSTRLPLAEILPLSPQVADTIEQVNPELARLGFELEFFGDHDLAIKGVPSLFPGNDIQNHFQHFISEITQWGPSLDPTARLDLMLKTLIHLHVNNQQVEHSWETIEPILNSLNKIDESLTCPLGNPVLLKLSWQQMEHHFKTL